MTCAYRKECVLRVGLASIALVALMGAVGAGQASAEPACTQSAGVVSCAFASTGAEQTFTVPANVSSLGIQAVGAPGGAGWSIPGVAPGGVGAVARAKVSVTAGESLYIDVGGQGGTMANRGAGGFNGGGNGGGFGGFGSGGGGGASDVRTAPRAAGLTPDTRLIIAAGGGGGGQSQPGGYIPPGIGGAAGQPGFAGTGNPDGIGVAAGGQPGSKSAGGSGGEGGVPPDSSSGADEAGAASAASAERAGSAGSSARVATPEAEAVCTAEAAAAAPLYRTKAGPSSGPAVAARAVPRSYQPAGPWSQTALGWRPR